MDHNSKFEDQVSAITDRVWSQLNRNALSGISTQIEILGIKVNGFMTRDQVRYKIHEAARRTSFAVLDSLS